MDGERDSVKIKVNGEARTIGYFENEGERFVAEKPDNGFCRKHSGYGINHEAFKNEVAPVAETVIIEQELSTGEVEVWMASIEAWKQEGVVDNLGQDTQIFLSKDEMSYEGTF